MTSAASRPPDVISPASAASSVVLSPEKSSAVFCSFSRSRATFSTRSVISSSYANIDRLLAWSGLTRASPETISRLHRSIPGSSKASIRSVPFPDYVLGTRRQQAATLRRQVRGRGLHDDHHSQSHHNDLPGTPGVG